jgi:hypothetical protein
MGAFRESRSNLRRVSEGAYRHASDPLLVRVTPDVSFLQRKHTKSMLRRLSTQRLRPDVLVSMSPRLWGTQKVVLSHLFVPFPPAVHKYNVPTSSARIKARLHVQQQHASLHPASRVFLSYAYTHNAISPHPTTTRACHACKRKRTFSTVWHWEHLVLKILAPFSADMAR